MKTLITNDDGIDAPGLKVLAECAARFGDVIVIAPHLERSSCGHQVTTNRPLCLEQRSSDWFAVDGTPADCVRIGLLEIAPDVEWVLSGINDGGNLGVDVLMSGTVAAVREAALLGWKGIAFSQYRKAMRPRDWSIAARFAERVIADLQRANTPPLTFWNVNFPDPDPGEVNTEIIHCALEPSPLPMRFNAAKGCPEFHYQGEYHNRPRQPGSDVDVCFSGHVSVSTLRVFGSV